MDRPDAEESSIHPDLLELLRCPISHAPLILRDGMLYCRESRRAYRIEDGVPVMLAEESIEIGEDELPGGESPESR